MSPRSVRLPAEVQAAIRALHPGVKQRVRAGLDRIRQDPAAGKALMGNLTGWRSLRIGRLRIVYREVRRIIEVAAIGPRATIYAGAIRRVPRVD